MMEIGLRLGSAPHPPTNLRPVRGHVDVDDVKLVEDGGDRLESELFFCSSPIGFYGLPAQVEGLSNLVHALALAEHLKALELPVGKRVEREGERRRPGPYELIEEGTGQRVAQGHLPLVDRPDGVDETTNRLGFHQVPGSPRPNGPPGEDGLVVHRVYEEFYRRGL